MTEKAKKITEEFISFTEICYPFMWDSVKKDERKEIISTLEALIDSEDMLEDEKLIKAGLKTPQEIDKTCIEVLDELFGKEHDKNGKIIVVTTPKSDNGIYDNLLRDPKKIEKQRLSILDDLVKPKNPHELDELFGESGGYKS